MTDRPDPTSTELSDRVSELSEQLVGVLEEIRALRGEVSALRAEGAAEPVEPQPPKLRTEEANPEEAEEEIEEIAPETAIPVEPEPEEGPEAVAAFEGSDPGELEETGPEEEVVAVAAFEGEEPAEVGSLVATSGARERARRAMDLEAKIGSVWLNRIGLVSLIIGIAFLAREVEPKLEAWHRVALGYLGGAVLFGIGRRFEAKLQQFARPVMAGGLAVGFFISFAGYFLPRMQCLPLLASLGLMAVFVGGIFYCAERWAAQNIAGLALLLGHIAAYVASVDTATLPMVAVFFLSAAAVGLMARHSWYPLASFAVIAAFTSHVLWTLRGGTPSVEADRFGITLFFLTSYYAVFLAADSLFFRRLGQRGREAFTQRQRVTGRYIGPTAMLAYTTVTAVHFQLSGRWSQIHWVLLPLAAVQLGVLFNHRRHGSSDSPLYLTASTTFVTMALFSVTGGLALNMALATEALLLLILGRAINFWFLRPLAQTILVVNFLHFWFSGAKNLDSWPTFVGAVLMASVYFVKSWLNETWAPISEDQRMTSADSRWSKFFQRIYRRLSVPVAHWQTLAGATLMAYQCDKFLGAPLNGVAVASLAAVAAGAGLYLRSAPLLQGGGLLQFGAAFLLARQALGPPTEDLEAWTMNHLGALVIALTAAAALAAARRDRRKTYIRFASMGISAAIVGAFAAAVAGGTPLSLGWKGFSFLALVTPLALWLAIEVWPRPTGPIEELNDNERRFYAGGRWRRTVAALFTASLAVWGGVQAAGSNVTALAVLSAVTLALMAAAFLRGSPYLLIGLLLHLPLTMGLSLWLLQDGDPQHALLRWWLLTLAVGAAVVLLSACSLWKRGSYALGGLVAMAQGLAMFSCLALLPEQHFSPVAIWFLPVAGLFLAVEVFRGSPARCPVTLPGWPDHWGQKVFSDYSRAIAGVASVLSAAGLGLMLGRAFPSQRAALMSMMAAAVILLLATLWRNSPYLMAGLLTLLGLMTAHRLFYGGELIERPLLEWASVTVLMVCAAVLLFMAPRLRRVTFAWGGVLTLTLGLVALGEFLFNQRPGPSPSGLWLVTFAAAWWAAESLSRGFWHRDIDATAWLDTLDLEPLRRRALGLAVTFSGVLAVLLIALTWRQFPSAVPMIYATLAYSVFFVLLTLAFRSPSMAAGFAVCLSGAHPLFYLRIGATSAAGLSPVLALLLLAVTLAAGVAAEWIFRHYDRPDKRRPGWWAAWYPYLLGFGLALAFLGPWGERMLQHPALGAPVQIALAVLAVALARPLRLRWLTRASIVYALVALVQWGTAATWIFAYRAVMVQAAVVIFVELLIMERILAGQDPMALSRKSPRLVRFQRWVLTIAAASQMMFALYLSRQLRASWTTAGWSVLALALMAMGFLWQSRAYRRVALVIFSAALLRLFTFDMARLESRYLMLALLCVGVCLIAVSYLYSRYREEIRRWL